MSPSSALSEMACFRGEEAATGDAIAAGGGAGSTAGRSMALALCSLASLSLATSPKRCSLIASSPPLVRDVVRAWSQPNAVATRTDQTNHCPLELS